MVPRTSLRHRLYWRAVVLDARISVTPVLRLIWAPIAFVRRMVLRAISLGLAGFQRVRRAISAFDARARRTQVLRFGWWPVVVLWWGASGLARHIFRFLRMVPYRFLARVAGALVAFVLALEVIHNWQAEHRWKAFRKRAIESGVALQSPWIPPPPISDRENLAAGFPFDVAKQVKMGSTLLQD